MARIYRYFPKKRGPISPLPSAPPYISYWVQPTNQLPPARRRKRQQPITNAGGWLRTPNATTTRSSTISGQIRVSLNPSLSAGYIQPSTIPLRHRWNRRPQPPPRKPTLAPTTTTATISGQIRVSSNPSLSAGWIGMVNQPLRQRWLKRQQPLERPLVPTSSSRSATIGGQIRVSTNPSLVPVWARPTNQPRGLRYRRIEIPGGAILAGTNTVNSVTISGQIRVSANPALSPVWKQLVNQPLKYRVPKRQQPPAFLTRVPVSVVGSSTIGGQIRVSTNPALNPAVWKQLVNQPLKSRVPKRQQPFAVTKRFQIISGGTANIGGQIRVSINPSLDPSVWVQLVNQPLKSRIPRRQQPFAVTKHFFTPTTFTATIGGQIRVSSNPAINIGSWKQRVNQLHRSRIPKRQQPFALNKRFGVSVGTIATIGGRIRISMNPSLAVFWQRPVNQPLKSRVPKRLMVNRVYPARPISAIVFDRIINITLTFRKPVVVQLKLRAPVPVTLKQRRVIPVTLPIRHPVPVTIVVKPPRPVNVVIRKPISAVVKGPNVN